MAAFSQMRRGKQQGIQHEHYFLREHLFPPIASCRGVFGLGDTASEYCIVHLNPGVTLVGENCGDLEETCVIKSSN